MLILYSKCFDSLKALKNLKKKKKYIKNFLLGAAMLIMPQGGMHSRNDPG